MKNIKILMLALCIISCLTGSAQTTTLSKPAYSIKYPSTWTLTPGATNATFNITSPNDADDDTYVEFIDMVVNKLTDATMDAEKYAMFSKGYLPSKIPKFKVLESKKIAQNKDGYFMVFTGLQNGKACKWKQSYFVKAGKVYIITYTAEAAKYESYKKVVDPMFASFTLK
jgi:eukaryotic-like serine/threonine-protein kinase